MAAIVSSRSLNNITTAQNPKIPDKQPSDGDINIAQGLLVGPSIPTRKYSVGQFKVENKAVASMYGAINDKAASFESTEELPHQYVIHPSNTWTSSSGDAPSDHDKIDRCLEFRDEYNRLASKHGVRALGPDDEVDNTLRSEKPNWFRRNILRRTSSAQSTKVDKPLKHRRSISDLSGALKLKKDHLKDKSLKELVRLCGLSLLYLPAEYASRSLALPTCFRATAQYLVQYGVNSRGVFRIPGSHTIVTALYNHYGTLDEDGDFIAGTVRCPTLPSHIKCDVHDVASAFKRFLAGLPDGILGSLPVFYSLVSIHGQLLGDPELTKTKQTKVRARLIALAIMTLKSQYRRDLICAVFGLLTMIGRAAEIAPREDDRGRPLPTSDLMGYAPLGIVFGPLLLGDLLDNFTMRVANPRGPLVLLPLSPAKGRSEKQSRSQKDQTNISMHKRSKSSLIDEVVTFSTQVDKVKIANQVTEMLITHWREVVRHLRALQPSRSARDAKSISRSLTQPTLRPSASESFTLRKPPDWGGRQVDGALTTPTRGSISMQATKVKHKPTIYHDDSLVVKRQRGGPWHVASQPLQTSRSISVLSPTQEEHLKETDDQGCPSPKTAQEILASSPRNQKENQSFQEMPIRKSSVQFIDGKGDLELPLEQVEHIEKFEQAEEVKPQQVEYIEEKNKAEKAKELEKSERTRKLESVKKPSLTVTITRSPGIQTASKVVRNRRRRTAATDPGNWPLKPTRSPRTNPPKVAHFSQHLRGLESGDGAGCDPLESVPLEEDLKSLAALANVLECSDQIADVIEPGHPNGKSKSPNFKKFVRKQSKNGSSAEVGQSKTSSSPKATANSPSGPMRLLKVFGSQKNRHSNKTSSTVSTSFSTSSKTQSGLVSALGSKNTTPCSNLAADKVLPRTPSQDKALKSQVPVTKLQLSPYGTVRALAAKFDTVDLMSVHTPSPTKSPERDSLHNLSINSGSTKNAVVAAYTTNESSPARPENSDAAIPPELSPARSRSVGQFLHENWIVAQGAPTTPTSSANYSTSISSQLVPRPLQIIPSNSSKYSSLVQAATDTQCIKESGTPRDAYRPPGITRSPSIRPLPTTQKPVHYDPSISTASYGSPGSLPIGPPCVDRLETIQRTSPTVSPKCTPRRTKALNIETAPVYALANNLLRNGYSASFGPLRQSQPAVKTPPTRNKFSASYKCDQKGPPCDLPHPVPARSNSVLSAQVQAFRKELEVKSDEIRHLKQRLNSRNSLAELGTLTRELRSAKEEIRAWQLRAQLAEKQIEMLTSMSAGASTGLKPRVGSLVRPNSQYCNAIVVDEQGEGKEVISKRATPEELNIGLDGAASPQRTVSGESSDTVIHSSG